MAFLWSSMVDHVRIVLDHLVFVIISGTFVDSIMYMCCTLYLMFVHDLLRGLICNDLIKSLDLFTCWNLLLVVLMIRNFYGMIWMYTCL